MPSNKKKKGRPTRPTIGDRRIKVESSVWDGLVVYHMYIHSEMLSFMCGQKLRGLCRVEIHSQKLPAHRH